MGDLRLSRVWVMRLVFVLCTLVVMFFHMLPLSLAPTRWAAPDLILVLGFVWATRRPDYVPALLVAGLALLCDFLFQRPPGLWSALVLIAVEWAKSFERRPEENSFALEWINFAVAVIAISVVYRLVLAITVTQTGPLALWASKAAFTIAAYPLVVLVSHFIFRVRRTAPGDLEATG